MKKQLVRLSRVVLLVLGVVVIASGCESTDETSTSLSVAPASVTFQTHPDSVTFVVSGSTPSTTNASSRVINAQLGPLSMPLVWAVSRPNLGTIVESSGNQAVYSRTSASGINIVTVVDQYGQEGIATVNQPSLSTSNGAQSLSLSASPNPIPNGQNQSIVSVVSSGTAPYTWQVLAPSSGTDANGSIATAGSSTTETYQSGNAGANLVKVTDAEGVVGTITITQQ